MRTLSTKREVKIYVLLTKREGCIGRISARGLDSTDRAPIFSQYGPEQAWLIRNLLHDWIQIEGFSETPCNIVGKCANRKGFDYDLKDFAWVCWRSKLNLRNIIQTQFDTQFSLYSNK